MFGEKMEALESEKWFVDSGDGGCLIKWKTRHHLKPGHTHVPEEESKSLKELSVKFLAATEAYLVAHPHVST
ncbi:pathogenesis-related protein STH-2 [Dorcoceras hygrometricum]|uniref:Pathogenesis-related protein STH-2 n=1 Tax=Dorcoceras hygrometricum TaxID=472368 RepID=A0A2Z7DHB0_9LAMI|nr:pathogenesis-related protein STH-2 [Dorcoceras hygrometricum]